MTASGNRLKEFESRPAGRFARVSNAIAAWSDAHSTLFFVILSGWYVALTWNLARRPLWFDELSTFYIAQQPTISRMLQAIRSIDLNPPLDYFLTRWSLAVFGASPWAARLPSMVAFWCAALAIFVWLRHRASTLVAAIGVLLFWCSPYFPYAAEARPYALLLAFTAILLAAWDRVITGHRRVAIATMLVAGLGLLFSHIFGVLSLFAVWVGEAVRSWRERRVDWPVAGVLVLPLAAAFTYGPMLHSYGITVFPQEAQVSWGKAWFLYYSVFRWMWRPLLVIAVFAGLALRRKSRALRKLRHGTAPIQRSYLVAGSPEETVYSRFSPAMGATLALLFLVPLGVTILFMRSHGAFYDRYGMVMVLPIVLVAPLLLQWWMRAGAQISFAAFCWIAVLLLLSTSLRTPLNRVASAVLPSRAATKITGMLTTSVHGPFRPWWKKIPLPEHLLIERDRAPLLGRIDSFHPDLPLVASSELTFVEMDNRESSTLTRRLFYLTDHRADIEIAHRSITEGMATLKQYFPLRATITPYSLFVQEHRDFLVIGLYEHPGDWLLRKAEMDGATIQVVGRYVGYDDTDIYLAHYPVTH